MYPKSIKGSSGFNNSTINEVSAASPLRHHLSAVMAFDEELLEIFSRLPAKAIYKFTTICKSFNTLASEHFFIKKQSQNMQLKDDDGFFIQPHLCEAYTNKLELHSLNNGDSAFGVPYKSIEFLMNAAQVLASSNGLVCCRNATEKPTELFICNPATRTWLSIPLPADTYIRLRIVFECNYDSTKFPHDYMLMVLEDIPTDWSLILKCKIYSPKERTWTEIGDINMGARNIQFEMPVYYNGAIHFISDHSHYLSKNSYFYWPYIVAYDIQNGSSRFLQIPKTARKGLDGPSCKLGIFRWGNASSSFKSICLIKLMKLVFSAWILIDYNTSSWTQILKKRVRAMGLMESNPSVAGFTVLNGNSLLFATEKVYRYNLAGDQRYEKAEEICRHGCGESVLFHPYSNTFRLCGDGATSLAV